MKLLSEYVSTDTIVKVYKNRDEYLVTVRGADGRDRVAEIFDTEWEAEDHAEDLCLNN